MLSLPCFQSKVRTKFLQCCRTLPTWLSRACRGQHGKCWKVIMSVMQKQLQGMVEPSGQETAAEAERQAQATPKQQEQGIGALSSKDDSLVKQWQTSMSTSSLTDTTKHPSMTWSLCCRNMTWILSATSQLHCIRVNERTSTSTGAQGGKAGGTEQSRNWWTCFRNVLMW